ncbi:MAG: AEC family transporter [Clostridia bacterium]|nr:AEC family transporter [Clostridia bacterium]
MVNVLLLTLQQFAVLLFFLAVGYILNRTRVIENVKPLSAALMWVFIPAVVFNVFYRNFTVSNFTVAMPYALAGLILMAVLLAVSYPIVRRFKDRITRNTYWYSLVITNMSYVGFPLVSNVFPELYIFFMVFITAFQVYIFTVGVAMLKPEREKVSLKGLFSPIMIALAVGMACGLIFDAASIKLPSTVENIIDSAAACMSPVAMLITGFTLAKLPLGKVFTNAGVYVFTALRLIVFPVVFGGIFYLLHLWFGLPIGIVKVAVIYLALPMGINTVVFAEANGADGTVGAQCAFISHAACVLTLPLIFALASIL